jgi:hypothetical protein
MMPYFPMLVNSFSGENQTKGEISPNVLKKKEHLTNIR